MNTQELFNATDEIINSLQDWDFFAFKWKDYTFKWVDWDFIIGRKIFEPYMGDLILIEDLHKDLYDTLTFNQIDDGHI